MNPDKLTGVQLALRPHRITGPVMAQFIDAAAIMPKAAIRFRPGSAAAEAEFRKLLGSGVLKNYGDGYWFDLRVHYENRRASEVRWMIGSVAAALAIAAVAVMFYRG